MKQHQQAINRRIFLKDSIAAAAATTLAAEVIGVSPIPAATSANDKIRMGFNAAPPHSTGRYADSSRKGRLGP